MRMKERVAIDDLQQQQQQQQQQSLSIGFAASEGEGQGGGLDAYMPPLPQTRLVIGATMLMFERLLSLTFPWPLGRSHYQHQRHSYGNDQAEFQIGDKHHHQCTNHGQAAAQRHTER